MAVVRLEAAGRHKQGRHHGEEVSGRRAIVVSGRVEIRHSLVLDVPKSCDSDRNLFDLETDDGASYVELPKGCWVRGVFGDQLALSSSDMPRPNTTADNERRYAYSGRLTSDAVIHSLTAD